MRNVWWKGLFERKKKGQIKEMTTMRMLILSYTIQLVIPNLCTQFQNPSCSSSWEIFDTNLPMHYIVVRGRKLKKEKRRQNKFQHHGFLLHYILQTSVSVKNAEDTGCLRSWEMCDKTLFERKKNWTNKGNDKHEDTDSLLHNTIHTQCLFQISKSYVQ